MVGRLDGVVIIVVVVISGDRDCICVLLLMCGRSLVIHGISDDRDFLNFEIETSFIFDLCATRGVHLITVDIILYRPYTRSVIIVIVRHGYTINPWKTSGLQTS